MNTTFFSKLLDFGIYALVILLTFLLVFEKFVEVPIIVGWLGHWHPLILHFPIVLILVTIIQYWRKDTEFHWYLSFTTLVTLATAITGLILSLEGGDKGGVLLTHQWLGVSVAFIMAFWYWISQNPEFQIFYYKVLHGGLVILIVVAGHFGGMVTHGSDFLAINISGNDDDITLPDNPNIYTHIVQPVFNKKCVSCHNENKAKGELVMTAYASLMKGGESGSVLDMGDLENSELLNRINMQLEHEDHMPPKDEKQLNDQELNILKAWINQGAPSEMYFNDMDEHLDLYEIVKSKIEDSKSNTWDLLPNVSDNLITELSSEYCTIKRMFNNSNALQVLVFPNSAYSPDLLQSLKGIAKNIVELNLSSLPLGSQDLKIIGTFSNLELLKMSNTPIGDDEIQYLTQLEKLSTLQVYNTQIGDGGIDHIASIQGLNNIYIYNTNITTKGVAELQVKKEGLNVISISEESLSFKSVLPSPKLSPEIIFFNEPFYAKLIHPLKEIDFNYSIDGSTPDENSPQISDSILIENNFTMKYFASKAGWEPSNIDSVTFIKSAIKPRDFYLKHSPDQKYLGVGKSLLFDLVKGSVDFGDNDFMAFKDNQFILTCELEKEMTIHGILLSSLVQTAPHIFPPTYVKVYGGKQKNKLKLLGSIRPQQPKSDQSIHFVYLDCPIDGKNVKFLKIVVKPLSKMPPWHDSKGESAWFFIDEVVLR